MKADEQKSNEDERTNAQMSKKSQQNTTRLRHTPPSIPFPCLLPQ